MFSKLERVKTNFSFSLGVKRVKYILRIMEVGSIWETFDLISLRKKWIIDKVIRTTKENE